LSDARPRVVFITNAPLLEYPQGLFSPLASVRREIIIPARVLGERGIGVHVVSLPQWPADQLRSIVQKADCVVFGKLLAGVDESPDTAFRANADSFRAVIAEIPAEKRSVFCLSDDHFDASHFAGFYREVAPRSAAWMASSLVLKQRLEHETKCPVLVYPEVPEVRKGVPHVPRRRWRERLAARIARHASIGLDPWRIRVLWFGHATNVSSLLDAIDELRLLAREVPLSLECVTQPVSGMKSLASAASGASLLDLRIELGEWSLEYMDVALNECDAVILPQSLDDPRRRAKSNNRLVDALHAGRFALAHPLPAYQELEDYAWIGDSIADGVRWLLHNPGEALRRLVAGQEYVARHHSLDALADCWRRALELGDDQARIR
jgi:glycosyltransferase involved in cell wall biosynthesis